MPIQHQGTSSGATDPRRSRARTRRDGGSTSPADRPRRVPSVPGRGARNSQHELEAARRGRVRVVDDPILQRERAEDWPF